MMIPEALLSLRPGARWTLDGESLSGLTWLDDQQTRPTDEEILAEAHRLRTERQARRYQDQRRHQYPPLAEFADAMYWASQGDNSKLDAYYAACAAVKQAYPKPE
jgi:hypothetical protein